MFEHCLHQDSFQLDYVANAQIGTDLDRGQLFENGGRLLFRAELQLSSPYKNFLDASLKQPLQINAPT